MKSKRKSGFTLVELIVVIAILGILAVIAIPRFQQYVLEAQVRKEIANAKTIYTAAVAYDEDNGTEQNMSGNNMTFYNAQTQESFLAPFVGNDVEIKGYSMQVDGLGKYAVFKMPPPYTFDGVKMNYYVQYYDPRVITEEDPNLQTVLLNGEPIMYNYTLVDETDEDGNIHPRYMTVEEYLEQKEKEGKN